MPEENRQYLVRLGGMSRMEQALITQLSQWELQEWVMKYAALYQEMMAYYRCAMMAVETKFNVLNEELSLRYDRNPIESVKTRLKAPESIIDKMTRRGFPLTVASIEKNIHDIPGVRVICAFPSDIYNLAEMFLRQDDIHLLERKDYFEHPKPNGYRSLHLVVETPIFLHDSKRMMKVEVQFRTISMDWWASLEHKIRYKKDLVLSEAIDQELLNCAEVSAELDRRMERLHQSVAKLNGG